MEIAAMTSTMPKILPSVGQPVDPDRLQNMGKTAARLAETTSLSLTEAVVQTVEREKLNAEQVRRVVESANIAAFDSKFASMEGVERFVSLDDGPADPQQVLSSLGCSQSGEYKIAASDYDLPPIQATKVSAVQTGVYRTRQGAVGEVLNLRSKLSAAHEIVVQDTEACRADMEDALLSLSNWTKRAHLNGAEPGELYAAWSRVHPSIAKMAANKLMGGIPAHTKVAGRRINPAHPAVQSFSHFVKKAEDFLKQQGMRQNLEYELSRVGEWLQENQN